jgi:hypothetical protein
MWNGAVMTQFEALSKKLLRRTEEATKNFCERNQSAGCYFSLPHSKIRCTNYVAPSVRLLTYIRDVCVCACGTNFCLNTGYFNWYFLWVSSVQICKWRSWWLLSTSFPINHCTFRRQVVSATERRRESTYSNATFARKDGGLDAS